jgi:Tfp pilus assembly protein PilE
VTGERRAGFAFAELVVALVALGLLGSLSIRAYAHTATATRRLAERSSVIGAARAVREVLRVEMARGARGADWVVFPPDSVRVRAFRGVATVCSRPSDSTVVVRRVSGRSPDPSKDSVLVLDAEGRWRAVDLVSVAAEPSCTGDAPFDASVGSVGERWRLDAAPADPVLLRLFETGSYQLSRGALRYRRGSGGRQPLTAAVLEGGRIVDTLGAVRAYVTLGPGPSRTLFLARSP